MNCKYLEITKQLQHLKPVQEVVLVVVVDGEVVKVTFLLRHVLHRCLAVDEELDLFHFTICERAKVKGHPSLPIEIVKIYKLRSQLLQKSRKGQIFH